MKKLTLEKACQLFERDHGGCDDNTCSMSVAMRHGYAIHALRCWIGSGAASEEFDGPLEFDFKADREEAEEFCRTVSNMKCGHCDSVIWEPEWHDGYCSNCGNENKLNDE